MKNKKEQIRSATHTKTAKPNVSPHRRQIDNRSDLVNPTALLMEAISNGLEAGCTELDDRDIPRATNVVEWLTSPTFLNLRPYPKQLEDAIHIFSAACYCCSDTSYLVNIPIDAKLGNILDRAVLMKRGKCPRCGRTAMEMRHEWCTDPANCYGGRIKSDPPNDVVALEGQRCLVGSTLVLTQIKGLVPLKMVREGDFVWSPTGWKQVFKRYLFSNKETKQLIFEDRSTLRGGFQHRVQISDEKGDLNFKRFKDIKEGDLVRYLPSFFTLSGLSDLSSQDFYFKKVVEVKDCPVADLYDLTVDDSVYWTSGVLSHNSGKSTKTAMYSTYVLHRFLMLPNPGKYFGLLESVGALHSTFVSVTTTQAWENLWQPFSDIIDTSPWFQTYHRWLTDKGQELGIELWKKPDTYLWYGQKRLGLSFASADQRTLRGRTRFLACVSPDTLVPTTEGLIPIGETCVDLGVNSYAQQTVSHKGYRRNIQLTIRNESSDTLIIKTTHGHELTATPDHKVLIINRDGSRVWTRTDQLKSGMILALQSKGIWAKHIPFWDWKPSVLTSNRQKILEQIPTSMTVELAAFLGYHISEGSNAVGVNGNHNVKFSNSNREVFQDYVRCFTQCFGEGPTEDYDFKKDTWRANYYSKTLIEFLEFLGAGGNSETKQVPWVILRSPKLFVATFLKTLFEGDGHVDHLMVRYDSKSEILCKQLQVILGNFGILSSVTPHYRPEYNATYWKVGIYGEDRNIFLRKIGFFSKCKQKIGQVKQVNSSRDPKIEIDLSILRKAYCKEAHAFRGENGGFITLPVSPREPYRNFSSFTESLRHVTLGKLRRLKQKGVLDLIEQVNSSLGKRLKKVASLRVTTIASVEHGPYVETCDWVVDHDHSFPTNSIISHNCVDEVGWFGASKDRTGTSRVRADGDGTVRALNRSLATIRLTATKKRKKGLDSPDAYLFTISSPSSATDPIMRRYKKAESSPRMYYVKRATWEANPTFTEESLRVQEGDSFERDFQCDFCCNPPYSNDPWWDNESTLMDLCASKEFHLWTGIPEVLRDPMGNAFRWVYYKLASLSKDRHTPRCLAFDTGLLHNSFAWAVGGFNKKEDTVIIEDVGEIAPGPNEKIHHGMVWDELIKKLVESLLFLHVAWDRWESSRYVADLRTRYNIRSEQYSATMKDGKRLRGDMLNSKLILPKPECSIQQLSIGNPTELARRPRAHLLLQCLTARDGNGLPQKSEGVNDDLLRAVLLVQTFIRDNEDLYGRHSMQGRRVVGIGAGGRIIGGLPGQGGTGRGVVLGVSGRALGVGPRY